MEPEVFDPVKGGQDESSEPNARGRDISWGTREGGNPRGTHVIAQVVLCIFPDLSRHVYIETRPETMHTWLQIYGNLANYPRVP